MNSTPLISPGPITTRLRRTHHSPWHHPQHHPHTPQPITNQTTRPRRAKGFGKPPAAESTLINTTDDDDKAASLLNIPSQTKPSSRTNRQGAEDDQIAPEVWDRMLKRILVFVGTPMASGVALLVMFSALKEHHVWDVPLWLPLLTTLLCFGLSPIGIAYGTLSTSLDPEKKGSVLGWEEVQRNWPEMWSAEDDESK
ncbi:hypothetical protein Scep_020228 [Stephania cephalantha]|uniref:Uncharacterized protein n=1 Tax=Stephania cephalantha TaxID=152367 RepID=A0AAP0ICA5_9MAGN